MRIEACAREDLGAVLELYQEWLRSGVTPNMSVPHSDFLARELAACFFVARNAEGIHGFVHGSVRNHRTEHVRVIPFNARSLVLEGLYVHPNARDHHVGEHLVRRALDWAKQADVRFVKLDIAAADSDRILSYYERFGFPKGEIELDTEPGEAY